jgi:hypothetical protein
VSKKPGGGWSAKSWAGGGPPPVARHPHHPKPAQGRGGSGGWSAQSRAGSVPGGGGKGGSPKHHHHTAKHHPHKGGKKHQRRGLALGGAVACCAAEALAASLRLAGGAVSDADVLALYWATASDADDGASILATLEAAAEFGLAGVRPAEIKEDVGSFLNSGLILGVGPHTVTIADIAWDKNGVDSEFPQVSVATWGDIVPVTPAFIESADEAWQVTW